MELIEEFRQIITIDVGVNGAIVYQDEHGEIFMEKIKETFNENCDIFVKLLLMTNGHRVEMYVEHQSLRKPDLASGRWFNIHKLCIQYEMLKNVCFAFGGNPQPLKPQEWQSMFFVKGQTYKDKKKRLKEIATKLYPELKVTLWNCDALLMLYYKNKIKDGKKIRRTWRLN